MSEVFKKITDLKKEAQKRDAEKKEMEDVVIRVNSLRLETDVPYVSTQCLLDLHQRARE